MLSGTEAEIINSVARLKEATKEQIRRLLGFSLGYIGFLCQYLVRKGYLTLNKGRYSLAEKGMKMLLADERERPKIDRELLKELVGEVAREIRGELRQAVRGIKSPVTEIKHEAAERNGEPIKIKTDFEMPVKDETLVLESNVEKIGAKLEKEEFDIEKKVNLLKKLQKRRKR